MSRCMKCGKCDGGYYQGRDEASWVECRRLPQERAEAALLALNDHLKLSAEITVRGDELKCWVYDEEDATRRKTYLNAEECRRMAEAFKTLADRLTKRPRT